MDRTKVVPVLALYACLIPALAAFAFDTVINVTSWRDTPPTSIGSNTQLNVTGVGTLPDGFRAGEPDGSSTNVELNFSGHRADSFDVFSGATANLDRGVVWGRLTAHDGSVVNIGGDITFLHSLRAAHGSTVNILGGDVHAYSAALEGSHVNIFGGTVKSSFSALSGSRIHLLGGTLGDAFSFRAGSELTIFGENFCIDGTKIDGLAHPGDTLRIDLPGDAVLSGTLADGTPFAFSDQDGDEFAEGSLVLSRAAVAPADAASMLITDQSTLTGARTGQYLTIQPGGVLREQLNAGSGSQIDLDGGRIGAYFEAVNADVNVINGHIGDSFDAFYGSKVRISGGEIVGNFDAMSGSIVYISGGQIGPYFKARAGSQVLISGGSIGKGFRALEGSSVLIEGGEFAERFYVHDGGYVIIAGGVFSKEFRAYDGGIINLRGTQFLLDGKPVEGLVAGLPIRISDRDVILSGVLADGSHFVFDLNSTDYENTEWGAWRPYDFFATGATLNVTLVPEPSTVAVAVVMLITVTVATIRRSRSTANMERRSI